MTKQKLTTTLERLRDAGMRFAAYNRLVRSLQGKKFTSKDEARKSYIKYNHNEEINLLSILESNGADYCLFALQATVQDCSRTARLISVACARKVQHLMTDQRSIAALDVAERFANGDATKQELAAAWDAAWASAVAAAAEGTTARSAWDSAKDAAVSAAWAAAWSVRVDACDAAWSASWSAQGAQKEIIKSFLEE